MCQILYFSFSSRDGILCGNGAPLFFTCFEYAVLLLIGSANLGHRCSHSSRPMDFNKRRETPSNAYWRISRSWIFLPHIFLNNRTSPEQPVWATSAYNRGKYGNSPVGFRPKRRLGSSENTSKPRRCLCVACLALFAYMSFGWDSETSILILTMSFFRIRNEVIIIIFTFKRSIRVEVVTYRLDAAFGSPQLNDFDDLRHDQGII
jgi:hypothetical protein